MCLSDMCPGMNFIFKTTKTTTVQAGGNERRHYP